MFSMLRQFRALFNRPANHQTRFLLQSLVSNPIDIDSLPDEAAVVVEEKDLWKDYAAVGFDAEGNLQCLTENACWD